MAGDPGYERTRTGARLVLRGRGRLLILTGGEPGPGDSATSLRDVALGLGVPPEAHPHGAGLAQHARVAAGGAPDPRARGGEARGGRDVALPPAPGLSGPPGARCAGVEVVSRPADPASLGAFGLVETRGDRRIVLGEYLKLGYYILRGWA